MFERIAVLILMVSGAAAQASEGPAPTPSELGATPQVALGAERLHTGDLHGARSILERVLEAHPDNLIAGILLAELVQQQQGQDLDRLEKDLRRVQELNPASPEPLRRLAQVLRDEEKLDRAETVIHDGLDAFPGQAELLHVLGTVKVKRGDLDGGLRLLQEAASTSPNNLNIQKDLGLALLEKGSNGKALMILGEVRDRIGTDPTVRRALYQIYTGLGDERHAAEELREAEHLEQRAERAATREKNLRELSDRIHELERTAAIKTPPDGTFVELWELYQRRGDKDWNLPRMEDLAGKHPESAEARAALGHVRRLQGNVQEAKTLFQGALEDVPDLHLALQGLFQIYLADGSADTLVLLGRTAVEKRPASSYAHLYLARALAAKLQNDDATASYRKALELDPENLDALLALANHLRAYGGPAEAHALMVRALVVAPKSPRVLMALGLVAFDDRDYEGAWNYLSQAEDLGGRHPQIFWKLGVLLSRQGYGNEAWDYWNRARKLDPRARPPEEMKPAG
jgi:tetratricopeptide (TPR) repeat protein